MMLAKFLATWQMILIGVLIVVIIVLLVIRHKQQQNY
jgi:uncharacterized membrane-anchored protein YhcB (DUF1043 family)